jgi:hypothetical protein
MNSGKLTDAAGRVVVNNSQITGDFELLNFTVAGGSPVPVVPTLKRRFANGFFALLDYSGGAVGLEWGADANARSYNIYRSINGGAFELLQKDYYSVQYAETTPVLYIGSGTSPLRSGSVAYIVRAVSKDLVESGPSNTITVVDERKPRLTGVSVVTSGVTNNWVYTLSFSEPLALNPAETLANYGFSNTGAVLFTINNANYLGLIGGAYQVQLNVTTSAALPVGYVLTVGNFVTDLAGNGIDPTANSRTF